MQEYNKMEDPMKSSKYIQVCYDLSVRGDENNLARLEGSTKGKSSNPPMMTDVNTYTRELGHQIKFVI